MRETRGRGDGLTDQRGLRRTLVKISLAPPPLVKHHRTAAKRKEAEIRMFSINNWQGCLRFLRAFFGSTSMSTAGEELAVPRVPAQCNAIVVQNAGEQYGAGFRVLGRML